MSADLDRPDESPDFLRSETALRLLRTRIALILGVVLMPAGAALDWSLYPGSFERLSLVRFITTAILAVGLAVVMRVPMHRKIEPLSVILIVLPSLALAMMMYLTNGGSSPYYFGLILLMIIVHLLGFRVGEAIMYCLVTLLAYLVAVFAYEGPEPLESTQLIQGIFFLLTSALVCILVCHVNRRNRLTAYILQTELESERHQLEQSLIQLKEMEQKLFQSEKMRAIAGLAAGLLHEINNPVNFSLMAVKVLKKRMDPDSPNADTLNDIQEGVARISKIVSDLRSFAHPEQEQSRTAFCLYDAVRMAQRFSKNDLQETELEIDAEDALRSTVLGSESQIVQVLLNLMLNAHNANEKVKTDRPPHIAVSARVVDDRVYVTVADTGIGMSAEQMRQVREPFFTTGDGQGLGLGLSICESIVGSHGGDLMIESEPNVGTKITFDIPLHEHFQTETPRQETRSEARAF